jgi:hypothetical protein
MIERYSGHWDIGSGFFFFFFFFLLFFCLWESGVGSLMGLLYGVCNIIWATNFFS